MEALLEEERSQRAQVETGLYFHFLSHQQPVYGDDDEDDDLDISGIPSCGLGAFHQQYYLDGMKDFAFYNPIPYLISPFGFGELGFWTYLGGPLN